MVTVRCLYPRKTLLYPCQDFQRVIPRTCVHRSLYRLKTFVLHLIFTLKIRTLSHGNKAFRWQESKNSIDRASAGDWWTVWIRKRWNTFCIRTNCYRSQNISPATGWWLIENALLLGQKSLFAVTIYWIEVDFFIGLKGAVVVTALLYSPCCIYRLSPCIWGGADYVRTKKLMEIIKWKFIVSTLCYKTIRQVLYYLIVSSNTCLVLYLK